MKHITYLLFFVFTFSVFKVNAQVCNPDSLSVNEIRAKDTDANISFEFNKHFVFYNSTCASKNTLVVHLVGSFDNPSSTLLFPSVAANNGFHVVSLKYPNSTSAQGACGNSTDANCYLNFRKEIIEGIDYSSEVTVDTIDCINNRLIKLLQYLAINQPSQSWSNYFSGNTINWSNIIISGHSQGGGHAAVIAKDNEVKRVLMFASPNDYSNFFNAPAAWTNATHLTQDSVYYGFNNTNDDVVNFSEQFMMWNNFGMAPFGDTVDVDINSTPYSLSRQLFTKYDTTGIGGDHSVMILDSKTPKDNSGVPIFKSVWEYMLGIYPGSTDVNQSAQFNSEITLFPNPASNKVSVKTDLAKYDIKIVNVLGQLKIAHNNIEQELFEIDLSKFETGIYMINFVILNRIVSTKKLVIK